MTKHTPDEKQGTPLALHRKVNRVVESLAKSSIDQLPPKESPLVGFEEAITEVVEAWRERARYLPAEIISDPAWSMLLELLHAEVQDRRVSLARACNVSGVSKSCAVRWLKALERHDFVVRSGAPNDVEDEFVELSPNGSSALRRYFRDVLQSRSSG